MAIIFANRYTMKAEPEHLPNRVLKQKEVSFRTPAGNSDPVYLAGTEVDCSDATKRFALPAESTLIVKLENLRELWIFGTAGDFLDAICEVEGIAQE